MREGTHRAWHRILQLAGVYNNLFPGYLLAR